MKWFVGLSWLLGLPFLVFAGVAIALIGSSHGDVGRILEGCLFAAGAAACATVMGLAQRAGMNRGADEAIERSAGWDAEEDRAE
ncbi:hypothetical protein [Curtobacterium sp. MCLR17_058]|uniref:hypothetical protein n=1 Tax=Curtobacterium sp. MCLR17_058 TaxID=2175635 RepID=UPI0011B6CD9E|nr:hypothetical protein [Curtobacterium sp. MCLR17_058]WIB42699.1 hypothetical protein DEJ11_17975 [Curtobacterium sp. MCLR17_058]